MFFKKKKYIQSTSPAHEAWNKLFRNKMAVLGLVFIVLTGLISLLGYLITPDTTPMANNQILELVCQKPGFSVQMLRIKKEEKTEAISIIQKMLFGKRSEYTYVPIQSYKYIDDKIQIERFSGMSGMQGIVESFSLPELIYGIEASKQMIIFDGKIVEFKDTKGIKQNVSLTELIEKTEKQCIVKKTYWLGTDTMGRDMLSRLIIGTRVSLSVGLISVLISVLIGVLLGAIAGYFRGWIDQLIVWIINVVWSIPTLLLVIAITFALGKGFWQIFIAVGLTMWVEVARVVRGQVMGLREKEFVEAARAMGFSNARIIFKHILPNVLGIVVVISAANFASAILLEAGLSFLGIGVQPPMPSWGTMIRDHYGYIILDKAYLAFLPGLAIMLMVLSFMMLGNGLRDAFDVREE